MSETETSVALTVNGRTIEASEGELLIDACQRTGTYIPRFCYHPRMTPVGMCRMCIVEIDTGRGPALQPSCMIPVSDGMTVDTESDVTKKAQDGVLEFLLANHPLDCPVCDKGGECPLQDQAYAYGPGESRFVEEKRHFEKPIPISDLVALDRERCILCDRCTRFADEVAGDALIHFIDRGSQTEVNTFPGHPFASYFSGNTVQICPVGALTATPYRFKARPWDLEQVESTCESCSVGCRMAVQSSRNTVLRHQGVDVDGVNWGWLCDKGRFGFEAVNSDERLAEPLVRQGDGHVRTSWAGALSAAATAIRKGLERTGPDGIAVLGGATFTNEDAYAWAKLAKGVIGTDHTDAQLGDGLPADLLVGLPRATIDSTCAPGGTILTVGCDLKEDLPVLYLRVRHAVTRDHARLIELVPAVTASSAELATVTLTPRPGEAAAVASALGDGARTEAVGGVPADDLSAAIDVLSADAPVTVVVGRGNRAESADVVAAAVGALADALPGARFLPAVRTANTLGAIDAGLAPGMLPGRVGLDAGRERLGEHWPTLPSPSVPDATDTAGTTDDASTTDTADAPDSAGLDCAGILQAAADSRIDVLVLLDADPLAAFPDRELALRALAGARTVVSLGRFPTESVRQADIILPIAGPAERDGTVTNIEGRVSTVAQKVTPPGTARQPWIVAAELALELGADLGIESVADAFAELCRVAPSHRDLTRDMVGSDGVIVPLPANDDHPTAGAEVDTDPDAAAAAAEAEAADTPDAEAEAEIVAEGEQAEHVAQEGDDIDASVVVDEEGFLYVGVEYERFNPTLRGGRPDPQARPVPSR